MSISTNDETSLRTPSSGNSDSKAAAATQTAKQQAADVAGGAVDKGKEVAGQAASGATAVASEAKDQAQELVQRTRQELMDQAESRGQQAATGLRTLSDQLSALGDGRTSDAGRLPDYLEQARTKATALAERLEQGGPQGVLDDVTSFARRRPGLFLVGAVGAGFLAGRLIRSGAASGGSGGTSASPSSSASPTGLAAAAPRAIGSSSDGFAADEIGDVGIVGEPSVTPTSLAYGGSVADVSELP